MHMQYSGPITTATSQSEGRLKVGAGCPHGKKKCLKCAIKNSKKDGKGGPGIPGFNPPGYGAKSSGMTSKPHRSSIAIGGVKMKGMKSVMSSINSLNKKMKFGKVVNSMKIKLPKVKLPKIKLPKMR